MGLTIVGILAVVTSVRPWSLLPILPLTGVLIVLRRFYMSSSRDIKRLEGVSKSPVFSQLSTSLQGLTTIRAFDGQQMLQEEFDHLQDIHTSTWFAFISTTRWFGLWLDWIVTVYMACVVYSFLLLSADLLDGEVGLAISSCMMLEEVQWMVRQTAEVENLMTSVERVLEYCGLKAEDLAHEPSCQVGFQLIVILERVLPFFSQLLGGLRRASFSSRMSAFATTQKVGKVDPMKMVHHKLF